MKTILRTPKKEIERRHKHASLDCQQGGGGRRTQSLSLFSLASKRESRRDADFQGSDTARCYAPLYFTDEVRGRGGAAQQPPGHASRKGREAFIPSLRVRSGTGLTRRGRAAGTRILWYVALWWMGTWANETLRLPARSRASCGPGRKMRQFRQQCTSCSAQGSQRVIGGDT